MFFDTHPLYSGFSMFYSSFSSDTVVGWSEWWVGGVGGIGGLGWSDGLE